MWKKALFGVLGVLGLAIVALLIAGAMQPDELHVERSREIAATPDAIHPHLVDLEKWQEWNPWAGLDPNMELTYSDPPSGQGAWYEWKGNDDVGSGRMEIESATPTRVDYDLRFVEPFESQSDVRIELAPAGEGTRVTWIMEGENAFVSKLFMVFVDMDAMLGADFERGLRNLERAATGG